MIHASKHSRLGQIFVEPQYPLHQNLSIDSFIYCEEEQKFRGEESDERPRNVEEKPTDRGATSGGYVKVQIVPCSYDQRAEAKRDDPESAPLL